MVQSIFYSWAKVNIFLFFKSIFLSYQSTLNSYSTVISIKIIRFRLIIKLRFSNFYQRLSLKTVSIIFNLPQLKFEDIYSNPLILLKCDELEIYKCGPMFEIILYIVKECLLANKNHMGNFIIESQLLIIIEGKCKNIFRI